MSAEPVARIVDGLLSGQLGAGDLSARGLGAYVGKTTGHVYHHWGSLSGLLFAVSKEGFRRLGELLTGVFRESGDLADVAEAFVAFGLQHPALYHVMFEHAYDWAELRERGLLDGPMPGLALWRSVAADIGPEEARILYAGLHGLVSLAKSGRANVGSAQQTDREAARAGARKLAEILVSRTTPRAPPRSR